MKENFRKVLKILPPQYLGDTLLETLTNAQNFAKMVFNKDKTDENAKQTLALCAQLENSIPIVEKGGKISKKLHYREILVDITKELKDMKTIRMKQKKRI